MVETHTRSLGIAPYDGMRTAMEQAAQAVWPDGNERNSSDATPSATSFFLSAVPACHQFEK